MTSARRGSSSAGLAYGLVPGLRYARRGPPVWLYATVWPARVPWKDDAARRGAVSVRPSPVAAQRPGVNTRRKSCPVRGRGELALACSCKFRRSEMPHPGREDLGCRRDLSACLMANVVVRAAKRGKSGFLATQPRLYYYRLERNSLFRTQSLGNEDRVDRFNI